MGRQMPAPELSRGQDALQFRTLANAIPQLCWMANADGWLFWYNHRWYEYTGTTPEQMEGWGWQSVHDPEALPTVLERWKSSIASGEPFDMVFPLRGADGAFRPFLTRVMPVRDPDGKVAGWFGTNTDISEQIRAEEALQRSRDELERRVQERTAELAAINEALSAQIEVRRQAEEALQQVSGYHRSLIEASLDPLATIASDGKITDVNRATETATGLAREALIGTDFCDYFTDPEKARAGYQRVFREGRVQDYELEIRHCSGGTTPVLYNASVYRDAAGQIAGVFAAARDISERKRAEEAVTISEQRLNIALGSAQMGIWELDLINDTAFRTLRHDQIFGYPSKQPEWGYEIFLAHVVPEDREPVKKRFEKASATGNLFLECRIAWPDRSIHWICEQGAASRDAAGQPVKMVGTIADITARKEAESTLREQAALLDLAHDAIIVRDPESRVVFWSRGAEETYGWPASLAEGRVTHDLLRTTFPTTFENFQTVLNERGRWEGRLRHVTRDGRDIVVTSRWSLQRDELGGVKRILEINRDVSDRVRAEAALEESEAAFRTLAELVPQLVWICNPDGLNVYFNQRWVDYTGLTLEESYGRGWNTPFHPEDKQPAWNAWNHAVESGGTYRIECRLRRADGAYRWFLIRGVPSRDATGRIGKWFGTCTDIEDLKRAEEEVRIANAELEQRVADRTMQLEATNRELESFAYSVSHDLRAPLRAMDGFSAALLSLYHDRFDDQGRHYLERIQQASQRMGQLIGDLLDLSRITRRPFEPQRVDLSAMAREIAAELQAQEPGRRAAFVIAANLSVEGDPHLLRVALENLLNNAWKFTGLRSLARIEVGALSQGAERVFFVCDNGAGFDMAYADKLFGPFQRLHAMQEFPGTGIGLATVQRIVNRHGGRIWAQAAVDQGATFCFTLQRTL